MSEISDQFREVIHEAVELAMERRRTPERDFIQDTHTEHHEWIAVQLAKENRKREFWISIQTKTFPAAVATLLTAAIVGVWSTIESYFQGHWKW